MMYINIADGGEKGVQFIPIGDAGIKDEFSNIKNISAQDVLTAHRFPAGLAGIIPQNTAGLPNPETARETYRLDEVIPVQRMLASMVDQDDEIPPWLKLKFNSPDSQKQPKTERPQNEVVVTPGESGAL